MRFRPAALALVLAAALALPGAAAADTADPRLEPVPAGPVSQVSRELGVYAGFPQTVALPAGGYLTVYGSSTSHFGPAGRTTSRRSPDGVVWANEIQLPGQTAGYSWGGAGLAAETAGQGGRVYLGMVRQEWIPDSQTLKAVTGYLRDSDDAGLTWSAMRPFPGTTGFYPAALAVLADGTLMASAYNSADGTSRYYLSGDRGITWTGAGTVAIAGRLAQEPSLCQLADGRVLSLLRSDAGTSQRIYATVRELNGTWRTPYVVTYDGSGAPICTRINDATYAVTYRGWTDRADDTRRPMRLLIMGVDPDGTPRGYRGNADLWPGNDRRYLYGSIVPTPAEGANRWRIVFGYEGPNGAAAADAQILSLPVEFREAP